MSSTILNNLPAALLVVAALVAVGLRLRFRSARRPGRPDGELVRVGGQVISQHRFTLRWTIRYPLPDGRPHQFEVPRTLPEKLTEGMPVMVLVDPADPRRARIDVPERTAVLRRLRLLIVVPFVVLLLLALPVVAFLASLD